MGSQGFRNIAGNPFVYQEDVISAAFGLDYSAAKWKLSVKNTVGALPTDTAQLTIDPSTNGDVTVDPNGSGNFVVTSGDLSLTAGGITLGNGKITNIYGQTVGATNGLVQIDNSNRLGSTNSPSVTGSMTAGTGFTATTGGFSATAGNLTLTSGKIYIPNADPNSNIITVRRNSSYTELNFLKACGANSGIMSSLYLGHDSANSAVEAIKGNTFIGSESARVLTNSGGGFNGGYNTGLGCQVLLNATSAQFNGILGVNTAIAITTAIENTIMTAAYGAYRLTTGNYNSIFGTSSQIIGSDVRYYGAGYNLTGSESNNVLIQASGITGSSNVLQIGDATGTGVGQLNAAYISGIYGKTVGATNGIVIIDNANKLGSVASLGVTYGGTGVTSVAQGDLLYASASNTLSALAKDANATRYLSNTGTSNNPAWAQVNLSNGVTGTLPASNGGRDTCTEVTGTSQSAAVNNVYVANNAALVTITLPATAAVGDVVHVNGKGAGLWKLAQNSGQTIHFQGSDTTTGAGGYLASTGRYDCVSVRCITADTEFVAYSSMGNITVV